MYACCNSWDSEESLHESDEEETQPYGFVVLVVLLLSVLLLLLLGCLVACLVVLSEQAAGLGSALFYVPSDFFVVLNNISKIGRVVRNRKLLLTSRPKRKLRKRAFSMVLQILKMILKQILSLWIPKLKTITGRPKIGE